MRGESPRGCRRRTTQTGDHGRAYEPFPHVVILSRWTTSRIRCSAPLGRAAFPRVGRGSTAALLLASNAPDVDIVTTAGGALNYLRWHRGPTHGPLGIVGLGLVCAGLVWIGSGRQTEIVDRITRPTSRCCWCRSSASRRMS